jgi:hypothetical protein
MMDRIGNNSTFDTDPQKIYSKIKEYFLEHNIDLKYMPKKIKIGDKPFTGAHKKAIGMSRGKSIYGRASGMGDRTALHETGHVAGNRMRLRATDSQTEQMTKLAQQMKGKFSTKTFSQDFIDYATGNNEVFAELFGNLDKFPKLGGKVRDIFGFASGGKVKGVGNKDTVPAMLVPGEYVIPKNRVGWMKKMGLLGTIPPKIKNNKKRNDGFIPGQLEKKDYGGSMDEYFDLIKKKDKVYKPSPKHVFEGYAEGGIVKKKRTRYDEMVAKRNAETMKKGSMSRFDKRVETTISRENKQKEIDTALGRTSWSSRNKDLEVSEGQKEFNRERARNLSIGKVIPLKERAARRTSFGLPTDTMAPQMATPPKIAPPAPKISRGTPAGATQTSTKAATGSMSSSGGSGTGNMISTDAIASLNKHSNSLDNFVANCPTNIEMTGNHNVNLNISGLAFLGQMADGVKSLVVGEINKALLRYTQANGMPIPQ